MTPKLDPKAYEADVVKPLRGASGSLPKDLVTRYAVDTGMTAEQLRSRISEIVALWNSKARLRGPLAAVYGAFQQAHEELAAQPGVELHVPTWWRAHAAEWAALVESEVAAAADEIRQLYGSAGFVLPGHIASLERRHPDLRGTGVRRALDKAGIPVVEPEVLPRQSGLDKAAYDRLVRGLNDAGAATIFHLLHPGVTGIRIFSKSGSRLDMNALERRVKAVEAEANSARSRAATLALGILRTAADNGTDLHQLAVYHVLDKVRDTRGTGQPPMLTIRSLLELGVAEVDARVMTASLLALEAGRVTPAGPDDVRILVAAGQLVEARRMAAALPAGDPDADAVRETIARAETEVKRLLEAARAEMAAGEIAEASRHASAARAMASDDSGVASFADSLPPPPPQGFAAATDGLGVKLMWQPVPGAETAIRYRVIRNSARVPIDPDDGITITESQATTASDAVPPTGERLNYAVFATSDRKRWSPGAATGLEILPPVADVSISVTKGVARCRWRAHPAAVGVEVRRTADGHPEAGVPVSGSGFSDEGILPETAYRYAIVAIYRDRSGVERRAEAVVITAIAARDLKPVTALSAEVLPGDARSQPRVLIRWRQPAGVDVRILGARTACPWPYGSAPRISDVLPYGDEVSGELTVKRGSVELTATLPWGRTFLTPFVFNGDTALAGQGTSLGITAPFEAVSYERRGYELFLSWDWPARANAADLRWGNDSAPGTRRITRGRLARDDGWVRIPAMKGAMEVDVRAVELSPDGDAISGPYVVRVSAAASKLSYTIAWETVMPGLTPRKGEVRVIAPSGCREVTVVAVAKAGVARPAEREDGDIVGRKSVSLNPDGTDSFPISVPRTFRKPYWLCCFIEGNSHEALVDPPVKNMKVGLWPPEISCARTATTT